MCRLSEDRGRSLVGAILSKVVPATFSTIASFSKMIWRSDQASTKQPEVKTQPFAKGVKSAISTVVISLNSFCQVVYWFLLFGACSVQPK